MCLPILHAAAVAAATDEVAMAAATFRHIWAAQYGNTALILASQAGHADCARLLLDAGADKEATDVVRASAGGGARVV